MFHGTVRNSDFQCNTALQNCCDIVSNGYNIILTLQRCVVLRIIIANCSVHTCNITLKRHSYALLACARLSVSADERKWRVSGGQANERKTGEERRGDTYPSLPSSPEIFAQLFWMCFPHYLGAWNRLLPIGQIITTILVSLRFLTKLKYYYYSYYYQLTLAEISQENQI